jgi:hypothetical protein
MLKIKSLITRGSIIVLALCCLSAIKPKLVKTKVGDDITVMIPEGWRPMDGMDFNERYPSVRAPLGAFTNEERLIDFSVNISATQWPDKDMAIAQKFFKSSLINMFDKVEIIKEGTQEINGKNFIFFEFNSRVNGNKREEGQSDPVLKYSYVQYLLGPSRTLVFSFNCPKRLQQDWQETAREMMNGVKVKESKK